MNFKKTKKGFIRLEISHCDDIYLKLNKYE
jgi:hypothetical protein